MNSDDWGNNVRDSTRIMLFNAVRLHWLVDVNYEHWDESSNLRSSLQPKGVTFLLMTKKNFNW